MKNKNSKENYRSFKPVIVKKTPVLERNVKSHHVWKKDWHHVQPTLLARKRNMNFKRDLILHKRKRHNIFRTTMKKHLTKKSEYFLSKCL